MNGNINGLLVPWDASRDNLNNRTAISLAYLRSELNKLPNREIVCVLDTAFSRSGKSVGSISAIKPQGDIDLLTPNNLSISARTSMNSAKLVVFIIKTANKDKLFICAAAQDQEEVAVYTPGQQGAFTYFFLKGLMGDGDQNRDGWVDTMEAYDYARINLVTLRPNQNPQINKKQAIRITRVEYFSQKPEHDLR